MNEFEKRAFKLLGEKRAEKVAGGLKETDELTNEQCENLRQAVKQLDETSQMQIAGEITKKTLSELPPNKLKALMVLGYGAIMPALGPTVTDLLSGKDKRKKFKK